jgi:hypothetical protein
MPVTRTIVNKRTAAGGIENRRLLSVISSRGLRRKSYHNKTGASGYDAPVLIWVRFISVETVPKVGENDQILSTKPSGRSFVQLIWNTPF